MTRTEPKFTSVEICAGAGGQAVGLHLADFQHRALIEIDEHACATLALNVKGQGWTGCEVMKEDLTELVPSDLRERLGLEKGQLDLLAGGVPCPPFSAAGKQLGEDDERDLFPAMLNLVDEILPKAVMIENVRGLLSPPKKFQSYRDKIEGRLKRAGYEICEWGLLEAWHYGVPQLRPRAILVAMRPEYVPYFVWPGPDDEAVKKIPRVTVGEALEKTMRDRFDASGSPLADAAFKKWYEQAVMDIAPTLVGGSKKHGGADLGPTRAKKAWAKLGVDGLGVANDPAKLKDPLRDLYGDLGPKLTVRQAAIIQGFPEYWEFTGGKTAAYRQVGNAFPPPVAKAVGDRIAAALRKEKIPTAEAAQGIVSVPAQSIPPKAESGYRTSDLESARLW
ncbi:DNA (cytosine-5-)-methyltransferase [Streptomyces sp. NPDC097640]|uniref:DNA cytosine methyltransferase n=1 Tax=Streptomyces sp. NPDC097640 TaxID=3157229 RepID=UPI00332CA5C9